MRSREPDLCLYREEITAQYEMVRKTLNEQVRKRHREAVKTRKRNGGKRSKGLFAHDDE